MSVTTPHKLSQQQASENVVRCLAIPLVGETLLLPHTAVAEVGAYEAPVAVPNGPTWLLGLVRWRGLNVPLVGFERLLESEASDRPARLVVFNTLNGNARLPFIAVPADAIPRLVIAGEGRVETIQKRAEDGPAVLQRVKIEESTFIIPDFDALEQMLLRLGIS